MKFQPRTTLVLAPLTLLLAAPLGDEATFSPGKHAILTKRFAERTVLELDSYEVLVGGAPLEDQAPDVSIDLSREVVLSDEYAEFEDGRVLDLYRSFEELGGTVHVVVVLDDEEEHEVRLASELEGALVRFEWDADEERYERTFEEGGSDDAYLEALEPEADLVGFLPGKAVAVDDTWDVDPMHLGRALAPSGDLRLLPQDLGATRYVNLDVVAMLGATLTALGEVQDPWEGEVEAVYRGSDEVDGVTVGRIEFEFDVTCSVDHLERLERSREAIGYDVGEEYTQMEFDWSVAGKGELLWDLAGGHAHALRCEAQLGVDVRLGITQPLFDQEVEVQASYALSGESVVTMSLDE